MNEKRIGVFGALLLLSTFRLPLIGTQSLLIFLGARAPPAATRALSPPSTKRERTHAAIATVSPRIQQQTHTLQLQSPDPPPQPLAGAGLIVQGRVGQCAERLVERVAAAAGAALAAVNALPPVGGGVIVVVGFVSCVCEK